MRGRKNLDKIFKPKIEGYSYEIASDKKFTSKLKNLNLLGNFLIKLLKFLKYCKKNC